MAEYGRRINIDQKDIHRIYGEQMHENIASIKKPPKTLYYTGEMPDFEKPRVAIIGSRNNTKYGEKMAAWFAYELAKADVQIISGMAKGIDGIAQLSAIKAGGKSFAVLGCGVDVCYPFDNRQLYDILCQKGGIISEYEPGTKARPEHFPLRNRIISALADIILVIEARQKSGTLITVDYGLEQGKDIFALPGNIDSPQSVGCNVLIQQGACIALSPDNIIDCLKGYVRQDGRTYEKRNRSEFKIATDAIKGAITHDNPLKPKKPIIVSEKEMLVCKAIGESIVSFQQLFERILTSGYNMPVHELMNLMMRLRIEGLIAQTDSNLYYLDKNSYPVLQ